MTMLWSIGETTGRVSSLVIELNVEERVEVSSCIFHGQILIVAEWTLCNLISLNLIADKRNSFDLIVADIHRSFNLWHWTNLVMHKLFSLFLRCCLRMKSSNIILWKFYAISHVVSLLVMLSWYCEWLTSIDCYFSVILGPKLMKRRTLFWLVTHHYYWWRWMMMSIKIKIPFLHFFLVDLFALSL